MPTGWGNSDFRDISQFFNPHNKDHMDAYAHVAKTGEWPEGFLPEDVKCHPGWYLRIQKRLADAWWGMCQSGILPKFLEPLDKEAIAS